MPKASASVEVAELSVESADRARGRLELLNTIFDEIP